MSIDYRNQEIVFLYRGGRENRLEEAIKGTCPTEFFYGAIELFRKGWNVKVVDVDYEISSADLGVIDKTLDLFFRYQLLPSRVYGPLLRKLFALRDRYQSGAVIIATTPGIAFAVSILKRFIKIPAKVYAIQLGLADYSFSRRRVLLNRYFLRRMHSIVYTELEQKLMREKYGLHESTITVSQFGVDVSFWKELSYDHAGYVLAIGSDGKRDYDLLLNAAKTIDRRFIIVTNRDFGKVVIPDNVRLVNSDWLSAKLNDQDILQLYMGASIVVTPLKQTTQPSGQSVSLQGMSCARPVIISEIEGLWSKKILKNNETVVFTEPGNLDDLRSNINMLLSDKNKCDVIRSRARSAVLEFATTLHWSDNLSKFLEF